MEVGYIFRVLKNVGITVIITFLLLMIAVAFCVGKNRRPECPPENRTNISPKDSVLYEIEEAWSYDSIINGAASEVE